MSDPRSPKVCTCNIPRPQAEYLADRQGNRDCISCGGQISAEILERMARAGELEPDPFLKNPNQLELKLG